MAYIPGTNGNDPNLQGTASADIIDGLAGNDSIYGNGGNDIIDGGAGEDIIHGGTQDDSITGGESDETDLLYGDSGNDTIRGGGGNDFIWGGTGSDYILGGTGNDIIVTSDDGVPNGDLLENYANGEAGDDIITGGGGIDTLVGDMGNDSLHGRGGNDKLYGFADRDNLYGDEGDDTLNSGTGGSIGTAQVIDGGSGTDTAVFDGNMENWDFSGFDWGSFTGTVNNLGSYNNLSSIETLRFDDAELVSAGAAPTAITDEDANPNEIAEDANNGDLVGISATSSDPNAAFSLMAAGITYSLEDNAGGRFGIDASTGQVYVANALLLDFETTATHTIVVRAESDDNGNARLKSFTIAITNGADRPTTPADANAATNSVVENAVTGTLVGITASSTDPDASGPITYSLLDDAEGRFAIDANTGVVTVADGTLLDYEGGPRTHTIVVQSSDGSMLSQTKSFTISVTDGIEDWVYNGTADDDTFTAPDAENYTMNGFEGNDTLTGLGGADILVGGAGDDTLNGGSGNDFFDVGSGDGFDAINGGLGTDVVRATADFMSIGIKSITGVEEISANGFYAVNIAGGEGNDTLNFTGITLTGIESINGGGGNDTITGNTAANVINGGAGDDTINGGDGNDIIDIAGSGDGFDAITGGNGYDIIRAASYSTNGVINVKSFATVEEFNGNGWYSTIRGSDAADTLNFTGVTLTDIAQIDGGGGNDIITGNAIDNLIFGGAGDDTINGGDGNDTFMVGSTDGFDAITGGNGYDIIQGDGTGVIGLKSVATVEEINGLASGSAIVRGTDVADTLNFTGVTMVSISAIEGGGGIDTITGSAGDDIIAGGAGNDILSGGNGNDTFLMYGAGDGADTFTGGAGYDIIAAGANNTTISITSVNTIEEFSSNGFSNVRIVGSTAADTLNFTSFVLNGIAKIEGGAGADTITGSTGNDTIAGGTADDILAGGEGDDVFEFGVGDGADTITGGNGTDTIRATADDTVIGLKSLATIEAISANGFANVKIAGTTAAETLNFTGVTLTGIAKIDGGAGADTITGSAGADVIVGGAADDILSGGDGDDVFEVGVGEGADSITGGNGADTIRAMADNTVIGLKTVATVETISANGFANVKIVGTTAAETLNFSGTTLTDIVRIDAGDGNDTVTGSAGSDTILGGLGDDVLNGGDGDDIFEVTGTTHGFDTVTGGIGNDVIVALANNTAIGLKSLTGIEVITANGFTGVKIVGSAVADTLNFSNTWLDGITQIEGGVGADIITGSADNNLIYGGADGDTLDGWTGDDTLVGGAGNDIYYVDSGGDVVTEVAAEGTDEVRASTDYALSANVENLVLTGTAVVGTGNSLVNVITGNSGTNVLYGGAGDDTLNGGDGDDYFDIAGTGDGSDNFNGGNGYDRIRAAAGDTVINIKTMTGVEEITSDGWWNVTIGGTAAADTMNFTGITLSGIERITGGGGIDTITGSAGADVIAGGALDDILNGGDGDDIFEVGIGDGADSFTGGNGYDTVRAVADNTVLTLKALTTMEEISGNGFTNVTIAGTTAADTLNYSTLTLNGIARINAGDGADTVTGSAGADTIVGGTGDDILNGGEGDDLFEVGGTTHGFDSVTGGNGSDMIVATANNTSIGLKALSGVEVISANGFTGVKIVGTGAADTLNFSNTWLDGITQIEGGVGADVITGSADNNLIYGGTENDTLDGWLGDDTLVGGLGADIYYVDSWGDVVIEALNEGTDEVRASTDFTLSNYVENLVLTGTADISGTGNSAINILTGNSGSNALYGGGGDDTLNGGDGNDFFDLAGAAEGYDNFNGGNGYDKIRAIAGDTVIGIKTISGVEEISGEGWWNVTINGTTGTDTMNFTGITLSGIERITGGAGIDTITGSAGADVINGGAADDILNGGNGDDIFELSGSGDGIDSITGGAGYDTVRAMADNTVITMSVMNTLEEISGNGLANVVISGTTAANVMNFTGIVLTGIAKIDGGAGADTITGSAGSDVIVGGAADDILAGGDGDDTFNVGLGEGIDNVNGGNGYDAVRATANNTVIGLSAFTNLEEISGTGFTNVTVVGTANNDVMNFSNVAMTDIVSISGGVGIDTITGSQGNDTIIGGAGNDILVGGEGDDTFLFAGAADGLDTINGGNGYDTVQATANGAIIVPTSFSNIEAISSGGFSNVIISGGTAADVMNFNDIVLTGILRIEGDAGNDTITGSLGDDVIRGEVGDDTINANEGNDFIEFISTTDGLDAVNGGGGIDTIRAMGNGTVIGLRSLSEVEEITANGFTGVKIVGSTLADVLDFSGTILTGITQIEAGAGADTITGSGGNDKILGGAAGDTLAGGGGTDRFTYSAAADSTAAAFDTITDFSQWDADIIDLALVDARTNVSGDQAFTFLGTGAFTNVSGQLRYEIMGDGNTHVLGDTDGNGVADFKIVLLGSASLVSTDFVL